uniref:Uncharacterized protein n=1 Tax=Meloidogyne enterolobii TaxID=390850 RepID=A0A6V7TXX5_MELEN|nr:unnamed protein product [Meloidogyne enterolobii]
MPLDLLDILFKFDFWGCLLLGYPLNIILIILIIFKTPKEMETHSRILIQNCVLDIFMLTVQMFAQAVKNMKIDFKTYLLYMFSTVLIIGLFYNLIWFNFAMHFIDGGIKLFEEEYLNETMPFVTAKFEYYSLHLNLFAVLLAFFIISVCGFKMVYYVNLHTGLSQNMKRLLKQLTKTLIILTIIPFMNQLIVFVHGILFAKPNNYYEEYNLIYIILLIITHFTPVFNPIVCIITNKPYKEAVFNRLQIHPQ